MPVTLALLLCLAMVAGSLVFSPPASAANWQQVAHAGIGNSDYREACSMVTYDSGSGEKLYVGTSDGANPEGCLIFSYDGTRWESISPKGFLDPANNRSVTCMAVNDGMLYAGTDHCEVWRYDGTPWEQVNLDFFTDGNNTSAESMAVLGGRIYVGTFNLSGCQVWRFDGPNPANWTQVVGQDPAGTPGTGPGFGDSDNNGCNSLAAFDGKLYAGTERHGSSASGAEAWRFDDPAWTKVGDDGLGDTNNLAVRCLHTYNNNLYAGTYNWQTGAQVLKYESGTKMTWTKVGGSFGDPGDPEYEAYCMTTWQSKLMVGTASDGIGNAIVYSYDGGTWTQECNPGFTGYPGAEDRDNRGVMSMATYDPGTGELLYAGTDGEHYGFEVWGAAPVPAGSNFYFAEGYTGAGFQEYLCIGNVGSETATASVSYLFNDGSPPMDVNYDVLPNSRSTIDVNLTVGPNREVSIRLNSPDENLVAERPMYFDYQGRAARNWTGGHDVVGFSPGVQAATRWYFAEGTTRGEFDMWVTVLNPNQQSSDLTFKYMIEGEGEQIFQEQIDGNSRATWYAADHVGYEKDVSLLLESSDGVVAERPMYFNYQGLASRNWQGGHCVVGVNAPARQWYLAEGTTRDNAVDGSFEEWVCIQNPNDTEITVQATYQLGAGQGVPVEINYIIPANQRLTKSVNQEVGAQKDVSVKLTSDSEFIAERPMYFAYHGWCPGGHDVMGANFPRTSWFFAEGYTGAGFEEWLTIQNPGAEDSTVLITYYPTGGTPIERQHTVTANTRYTVCVNRDAGAGLEISTEVDSDKPVICERPMYFNFEGWCTGGHDVMGYSR